MTDRRSGRRRPALLLAGLMVAGTAVVATIGSGGLVHDAPPVTPPAASQPAPAVVSPAGTGRLCDAVQPCSLQTALVAAGPGSLVELRAGDYGRIKVRPLPGDRPGANVTVAAQPGAAVQIAGIDSYAAGITWQRVTVQGVFYLRPAARRSVLNGVTVERGGLFIRADDVLVQDSVFRNGSSLDGIQIGGAHRVTVRSNTIRDYNQSGTTAYHADCIQIFDSADIELSRNRISSCYNAGVILSRGAGHGSSDISIESNYIQGCVVTGPTCPGTGSVIDLREPTAQRVIVRNNTLLSGSTRVEAIPGLVFDRNIVAYLSSCATPMTNSLVQGWNSGKCSKPDQLGLSGNRQQEVRVVNLADGNLRPVDEASTRLTPADKSTDPAPTTIDGGTMPADVAGATG